MESPLLHLLLIRFQYECLKQITVNKVQTTGDKKNCVKMHANTANRHLCGGVHIYVYV